MPVRCKSQVGNLVIQYTNITLASHQIDVSLGTRIYSRRTMSYSELKSQFDLYVD